MFNESLISSTLNLLQPIVDNLSNLENIMLKFVDYSREQVVTTQSRNHCSFCKYIKSNRNGKIKCQCSALNVALMAKDNCQPIFTQCHAGLTLVAVPIRVAGQYLGSIGFGEIKENANKQLVLERISSLNLDDKRLMSLYQNIPILTRRHVLNIAKTLYVISNYYIEMGFAFAKDGENNSNSNDHPFFNRHLRRTDCKKNLHDNQHTTIKNGEQFIINNYNKPIGLNDVASFLHINPSYFSYLFKQVTGYTFKNYLTQIRIEKAKDLLLNSSLNINQISQKVGYEDSNYFSRVFKKNTGYPPSSYISNQ